MNIKFRAFLFTSLTVLAGLGGCTPAPEPANRDEVAKAFLEDRAAWAAMSNEYLGLLEAHRFDELDRQIKALQQSYEQGANEWAVLNSFLVFSTEDDNYSRHFDAWVEADTENWPARLARGIHHVAMGWTKRGSKFIRDTPAEQLEQMRHHFAQAKTDVTFALEQMPRAMVGYSMLLQIARGTGTEADKQHAIDSALKVAPATYYIRWQHIYGIQSKWGGSRTLVRKFARAAQKKREQNPRLYALLGFEYAVVGEQARRSKDYERAVKKYTKAINYGPVSSWLYERAWCQSKLGRYEEAIRDLDVILTKSADDAKALAQRGYARMRLGQMAEASTDLQRAVQLKPELSYARNNLAWITAKQGDISRAVELLDKTLDHEPNNIYALTHCGIYRARLKQLDKAERCLVRAVELAPEDATAWRNYGDVLHMRGDPNHLEALALYLKYADPKQEGAMYQKVAAYLKEQNYSLPVPAAETPGPRGAKRE